MKTSQIVSLILGILGGLSGICGALLTMGLGSLSGAFGYEKAGEIVVRGVCAIILSILGMIGGGMVENRPKVAAALMLLASIVGFLISFPFYIPASALFISGGILILIRKRNEKDVHVNKDSL
jgi:hypothetical protein